MTNEFAIKVLTELRGYGDKFANIGFDRKEALDMAIKALEAQPTRVDETYLSIKDAIKELKAQREHIVGYMSIVGTTAYDMGIEALEAQPKKGKWIVFRCGDTDTFKCSECGIRVINPYQYCHSCGTLMEVEDE